MKVLFLPEVDDALFDLIEILYSRQYFSFAESAITYVEELIAEIETTICSKPHRKAPLHFLKYDEHLFYITCQRNQNTTWYVFFSIEEGDIYLIRNITNNHVAGQYFNL